MPNVPTIGSLQYLCNISKMKGGWSCFLRSDKHQTVIQVDAVNLGGHGMPAQIIQNKKCKMFAISQERSKGWSLFFVQLASEFSIN